MAASGLQLVYIVVQPFPFLQRLTVRLSLIVLTSIKEVMFSPATVCLSVTAQTTVTTFVGKVTHGPRKKA